MSDNNIITIRNLDSVQALLEAFPSTSAREVQKEFTEAAKRLKARMRDRTNGAAMNKRSGDLRKSFHYRSFRRTDNLADTGARVYTDSKYAPIHERGGIIKAKNAYRGLDGGPYLNIPSSQNQDSRGVTIKSAYQVFNEGGFILPINNGNKARYMVLLNGEPMYWLVKEVKMPARLGFQQAAEDEIPTLLSGVVQAIARSWT